MKLRYPFKRSRYSSHSVISLWVYTEVKNQRRRIKVLDIGCAQGQLISEMDKEFVDSMGVEPNSHDFELARRKGLNVFQMSAHEAVSEISEKFDVIIFADVLEHLQNPEHILEKCKKILAKDGSVIISVPNVAHFSNRLGLLFGQWNYKNRGILDDSHLRFFTLKTARRLCNNSGYRIIELSYTPIPLEAIIKTKFGITFKFFDFLNYRLTVLYPRLFAYQIILRIRN